MAWWLPRPSCWTSGPGIGGSVKELYIIEIEYDAPSVFFTEMTVTQANKMRQTLSKSGHQYSVKKIRNAPGFHSFEGLMHDFEDMAQ